MRNLNRKKALAVLSAAAGLVATVPFASAQVWNAPTTGNWNNAANWVGGIPVSGSTTALTFNASGAQTYTATNDIATVPFQLNSMTFGNTGTGVINVAGNQLSFTGTDPRILQNGTGQATVSNPLLIAGPTNQAGLRIGGTGAGTLTLSGAMTSNPAPAGTGGAALIMDNPTGRLNINGGGTLYALRSDRGSIFVTGGILNLTSTQRGNDVFGAPDDGFWGIVAGNSGQAGSVTFSNGAKVNANNGFAGNDGGETGSLTFTDPNTVGTFTGTGFGRVGTNWGTGTLAILNGAQVFTTRTDIGRNEGGVGTIIVNGANSILNAANLDIAPEVNASATGIVSGGGKVILTDGGNFSNVGMAWAQGPAGDALPSSGSLRITGTGSSVAIVTGALPGSGQFVAAQGGPGVDAPGTLTIDSGGHMDAENSFLGFGDGRMTMTVDGANSEFVNRGQFLIESAVPSTVAVTGGGRVISKGTNFTSTNPGDKVAITVGGTNSLIDMGADTVDSIAVLGGGGAGAGGTTTLTINAGGEFKANAVNGGQNDNSLTNIVVDGANARFTISGPDAQLALAQGDVGAVANMTVSNGGRATLGTNGGAFLSTGTNSVATMTVTGAGSTFDASAAGAQLLVAGSGSLDLGAATFNVLNNATATVGDAVVVFTAGRVNIGSGTTKASLTSGTQGTFVDGTINFNAGTFNAGGTLGVGGSVILSSAGRAPNGTASNKKFIEAGVVDMTTSGVIDLNDNDMLLHNDTVPHVQSLVAAARNGGLWNMPGITSTAAKNSVPQNKNLGVISGANFLTAGTTFNGKTVVAGDTLVKFTFNGDTDLNGLVDFDDYSRIDNGFNNNRTGWFNGDFDYNGIVDFDDYSLIDQAFNTQGTTVLNAAGGDLAGPGARAIISAMDGMASIQSAIGKFDVEVQKQRLGNGNSLQAVPEPGTIGLAGVALLGALSRRRRAAR